MEVGGHSPSIQSMSHAIATAQQHRAERVNLTDQTGGVKEQKILQQANLISILNYLKQGKLLKILSTLLNYLKKNTFIFQALVRKQSYTRGY